MKVAMIHDWILNIGGAERCLKEMADIYTPDIYTLFSDFNSVNELNLSNYNIFSSFLNKYSFIKKKYRNYLILFPFAIESFDLRRYDTVISSSHCVAKGVITKAEQLHICYCYTPLRYAWDLYFDYLEQSGLDSGLKGLLAKIFLHYMRIWDFNSASRVDNFMACSDYIKKRIWNVYRRKSDVVYPPVDIDFFDLKSEKEDYYIALSRFVSYKKLDMIARTFSQMPDKKLLIVGEGPQEKKLKKISSKNIEILKFQPKNKLNDLLGNAKAYIHAADEDFGILPVEAQACGTPVIAYRKGGLLETVLENKTGVFFDKQNEQSLKNAIINFENQDFDFNYIRKWSENFSKDIFNRKIQEYVKKYKEEKFK